MEISIIKSISQVEKRYKKFISDCKDVTVYNSYFWLLFLEKNFKAKYIIAEDNSKIVGILPYFKDKEENELVSLPYTGDGGLITLKNKKFIKVLAGRLLKENKDKDVNSICIKAKKEHAKILEELGFIIFPSIVSPILKLSTLDDFWNKTLKDAKSRKKLNKPLNKAEKTCLKIKEVKTKQDVKTYFYLEKATMARFKAKVKPLKFWKLLFETVPKKNIKSLLAIYKDKVIAGEISLVFKDTIQMCRGPSLKQYRNFCPNEFLHYHIVKWAIDNKYKYINYGASDIKKAGSYLYKKKFGGKDMIMWIAVFPLTKAKRREIEQTAKKEFKNYNKFIT